MNSDEAKPAGARAADAGQAAAVRGDSADGGVMGERAGPENLPIWARTVLGDFERRASRTGNCLHVWLAINFCFTHQIALPEFCVRYLQRAATELCGLIADATIGTLALDDNKTHRKPRLNAQQAAVEASKILGFTLHKDNAFRKIASEYGMIQTALVDELIRSKMVDPSKTSLPVTEERHRRRRVKTGKELRTR